MALDLAAGGPGARALLADADVLVENFKPGTLEKWGLGYETLSQAFPKLIHCRVSGFGADGPLGGLPGYDACAQAMCGLMSVNGEADGEATRVGLPVVDMVTGLNAAVAAAGAERARAAAWGSSWTSRCTTARCRCCTRTRPTISTAARRRPAAAMRIPTSRPMKRCPPPAARSSWPWATTASSRSWPPRWARRTGARPALRGQRRPAGQPPVLRDALSALLATHEAAALADRLLRAGVPAAAVQTGTRPWPIRIPAIAACCWNRATTGAWARRSLSRTPARLRRRRRRWAAWNQRPASGSSWRHGVRGSPSRPAPGLRGADPRRPASRPVRSRCRGCRWETR